MCVRVRACACLCACLCMHMHMRKQLCLGEGEVVIWSQTLQKRSVIAEDHGLICHDVLG